MIKIIKSLLIVLFLASFSLQAHSETSWITKKDKTKKTLVKKTDTKAKKNEWIKKKKEKEKKVIEKVKEKIKESKSWITKKSKKEKKIIKKELKKYYEINSLPKADLYFAAKIFPKDENEESLYFYGYVNSENSSATFEYQNNKYHSKSNGVAYFEDKKTSCEVNSRAGVLFDSMKGDVVLNCSNNLTITGDFKQDGESGKGLGGTTKKNEVIFEFYSSKNDAIAKLDLYKKDIKTLITRSLPAPKNNKNIKLEPNGKYYALLIGNSKYDNWDNLVSPENDIKEIKKVLDQNYKFEKIIPVYNGTKKEILSALGELSLITTENDYVLIYYSGHGDVKAEQAYWVPKDGSKKWGQDDWISINYIDIYIRDEIKAHHIAVLVDSCYVGGKFKGLNLLDNMTEEDSKIFEKQLIGDLNSRSRSVLSSGSTGPVSDTVAGTKHSMFALTFLNLLKEFQKSSIPVNLKSVAWNMDRYFAGSSQRPHYYHPPTWSDGGGDFIFIPKKNFQ
jgi:hypothetical protein